MAGDARVGKERLPAVEGMKVGSANTNAMHMDEGFAWPQCRRWRERAQR